MGNASGTLVAAASRGDAKRCQALVERGADVNACMRSGLTALHQATIHNHKDVVKVLIACGADINMKADVGRV